MKLTWGFGHFNRAKTSLPSHTHTPEIVRRTWPVCCPGTPCRQARSCASCTNIGMGNTGNPFHKRAFSHITAISRTHTHRQTESKTNIYTHTHKHQTSDCASRRRAAQYATEVHRGPCRRRRYPVLVFRIVSPAYPLPLCNLLLAFSAFPSFGLYGNGHGL